MLADNIHNIDNHDLGLFSETISNEYDIDTMMKKIENISAAKIIDTHEKSGDAKVSEVEDGLFSGEVGEGDRSRSLSAVGQARHPRSALRHHEKSARDRLRR